MRGWEYGGPHGFDGWGAGGVVMAVLMVAFWVAVIVAIVFLIRALTRRNEPVGAVLPGSLPAGSTAAPMAPMPSTAPAASPEAIRILEERYARGEIEREEFLRRREDLRPSGTQPVVWAQPPNAGPPLGPTGT